MGKIVISSNLKSLLKFLKKDKEKYFYLCLDAGLFLIEDSLSKRGYRKIDTGEGLNDLDFEKEYVDFIGGLNRDYNSLHWWATTASYKGTFISNLCRTVFNYYCVTSLIKKQGRNYILINNDAVLNNSIKKFCGENGIDCILLDPVKNRTGIAYLRRYVMSCVYFICNGWVRKTLASVQLSEVIKKASKKDKPCYVIRSWLDSRSFLRGGEYKDLYFGSLPGYLKQKGENIIILGGILTGYREMVHKIRKAKNFTVMPQEYFIGYFDYFKIIILNFFNKPKISKPVMFCGLDVTDFLRESLKKDYEYNEINKNLIHYYYIRGVLKKIKVSVFLYPFENQSWEKMSIVAFKKHSPSTRLIGYAHSSFRPYLFGYLCSKKEEKSIPFPDKIITVGEEFRSILEKSGNYTNNVKISAGCALRYEHMLNRNSIKRNKYGKILVALSMDIDYSLKLLKLLSDFLTTRDDYEVILRPHPFMLIDVILDKYNIKLHRGFRISKGQRLEEDLKESIAVIYADTTSCMEALMCGVPVIYVDLKEQASLDPLFNINSLKWSISDKNELSTVIDNIHGMDDEEYLRKWSKAAIYLKRYFYPVEEKYMKEFIV